MAYGNKYYFAFNNNLNELWEVYIAFDGWVGDITTVSTTGSPIELSYIYNDERVVQGIIPLEATIQILVKAGQTLSYEDFITQSDNEIYVSIRKDGVHWMFHGWVLAENGSQQFKDPPYIIELKCTDGLGLLKSSPLTTRGGTNLTVRQALIQFFAGALSKANHELNIKTWCDIYELSMITRDTDSTMDMFSQAYIDHRTFLNNEVEFDDCYKVLEELLSEHFNLFYYLGSWHILRVGDLQRADPMDYVEYDLDGQIVGNGTGDTNTAKVGKAQRIFAVSDDFAIKSIDFAQKSARLQYNYRIPENIVNNQKLTRLGAPLGSEKYNIVGWTQSQNFLHLRTPVNNQVVYIKRELDAYGYELQRYYAIPVDLTAINASNLKNYIINDNDDGFMDRYDKIDISFQYRYSTDLSDANSTLTLGFISLLREGQNPALNSSWHSADANGSWVINADPRVGVNLVGLDTTEWRTLSFVDSEIPQSGRLYIGFGADDHLPSGTELHIKDLQITYKPQIRGGYTAVKGDFNKYEQTPNYKNSIDEEVFISDAPKRLISGSFFMDDGFTIMPPTWKRRGVSESKRYTQLADQALFNLHYRKFRMIEGQFKGYSYEQTPSGPIIPFGPMTKFEFTDTGEDRQFICLNIKMDVKRGWFTGTFREIYEPGSDDGNKEDTYEFNYLF